MRQQLTEQQLTWKVREIASELRKEIDAAQLADFAEIAERFNLRLEWEALPDANPGCLANDYSTIVLNSRVSSFERQSFTFYHEFVHAIIRQDDNLTSLIHDAWADIDDLIERLCDSGAAELLMPGDQVRDFLQSNGFSAANIPVLCARYNASAPAVAIQMINCASHDCYMVGAQLNTVTSSPNEISLMRIDSLNRQQELLQVVYSGRSAAAKYPPVSRGTTIERTHLMYEALVQDENLPVKGLARIPFRSGKQWLVACDAVYFRGKIYAFFNISTPVSSAQLPLF